MQTNKKRPVFLNLLKVSLPVGGVVSISHRITGILLVLSLPGWVYLLQLSLEGGDAFEEVVRVLQLLPVRLLLLVFLWVCGHHFFAGIRHLLLDVDIGIEKTPARASAYAVIFFNLIVVITVGAALL